MSTFYHFWLDNGLALVGSPEAVIRQRKEQYQRLGDDIFCANHRMGTMPPEQSLTVLAALRLGGDPGFSLAKEDTHGHHTSFNRGPVPALPL